MFRLRLFASLLCAFAVPAMAEPRQFTGDLRQVNAAVLASFNAARMQPAAFVDTLTTYRSFFKANLVVIPGQPVMVQTQEGRAPVDEAIRFLRGRAPLVPLAPSDVLQRAAADHVAEQSRTGRTGHYDQDGSSPADRVERHGGGTQVAEVIAYGARDAKDVIRLLVVDDGVPDRGHRVVMFADHLRYAGVACGPHPQYGTMCVIDMSDTPDGSWGMAPEVHVAAATSPSQH